MLLGGGIKIKTIYIYDGEGADSNNTYIKIDDIVIQNPQDIEEPIGKLIKNTDFFNKCYNYIKEGYIFNIDYSNVHLMNINVAYKDDLIMFNCYVEGFIFTIVIEKNT